MVITEIKEGVTSSGNEENWPANSANRTNRKSRETIDYRG